MKHNLLTRRLFCLAILLTGSFTLSMNQADPDLWGHVQYGKEVLTKGAVPEKVTWTFTTPDSPWVNHENLTEIALAVVDSHAGGFGLGIAKFLMGFGLLALIWWHSDTREVSPIISGFLVLLTAVCIQFHWHFRPQVFGYLFFAMMLSLLSRAFAEWEDANLGWLGLPVSIKDRLEKFLGRTQQPPPVTVESVGPKRERRQISLLWGMIPLFAAWTNSHGGFAAGLGIFGVYMVGRMLEARAWWGPEAWPLIKRLALLTFGAALATGYNPYGFRLHVWLVEDVFMPRPEIGDWERLPLLTSEALPAWLLFGTMLVSILFTARQWDLPRLVILLATTQQAISHIRHLPFLAILCGFWLPTHLESVRRRLFSPNVAPVEIKPIEPQPVWPRIVLIAWIAVISGKLYPRITSVQVDRSQYPVAAMRYVKEQHLSGKFVVTFNWAQYALNSFAQFSPESRVAFDGRLRTCYPQEVIDVYFDFIFGRGPWPRWRSPKSGPLDPAAALNFGDPDFVLLSREQVPSVQTMQAHANEWTLLYQDSLSQLWGRTSRYGDPHSPDFIAETRRRVGDERQAGLVPWPAN